MGRRSELRHMSDRNETYDNEVIVAKGYFQTKFKNL